MSRWSTPLRVQRTPILLRQLGMLRRHHYARALGPDGALTYRRWVWSRAAAYRGLNQQRRAAQLAACDQHDREMRKIAYIRRMAPMKALHWLSGAKSGEGLAGWDVTTTTTTTDRTLDSV